MKRWLMIVLFVFVMNSTEAQIIKSPVSWTVKAQRIKGNLFRVVIKATLESGWHIYGQHQPKEAIANPTVISFLKKADFKLVGKALEKGIAKKQVIKELDVTQYFYEHQVEFVQDVFKIDNGEKDLLINVAFMVCTDTQCLPTTNVQLKSELN